MHSNTILKPFKNLPKKCIMHSSIQMIRNYSEGQDVIIIIGLSNKENKWSIRLAITVVKENIPCYELQCNHPLPWYYEDLPNGKGFKRIGDLDCQIWCP